MRAHCLCQQEITLSLQGQYNELIVELNDLTSDTAYKNYKEQTDIFEYETLIVEFKENKNLATTDYPSVFMSGPVEVWKGISKEIQWSPQYFGNPSVLKQMRESTVIFDQNNFYSGTLAYSSDVSAGFVEVPFKSKGVGYFGGANWGSQNPDFYWGGEGNDIPQRSIVPRQKQRGRYLNVKFLHGNSREKFRILGISVVVRVLSTRAYR
jgi:hypothetical protein